MAQSQRINGKVLVLDADNARAAELVNRLNFLNYQGVLADDPADLEDLADERNIAVLLGDVGAADIRRTFRTLNAERRHLPVLALHDAARRAVQGQSAPTWKLELPIRRSQLERLLKRAERYDGIERRQRITGASAPIRAVRKLIEQVADFDTNVLVTGESGTGKELVARTIHDLSSRAGKPFVPINCGAIPAELLESELFGHEKGAFTGAISARTGRFELAEGGTLFLDEIGDMSLDMQVKLLRVLQERTFERVGCNTPRRCNVRIVAATHRNLAEAVEKGTFRQDLYYRLNVFPIEMPPLYKRASDLPMLLEELMIQHQGADAGRLRMSPEALEALSAYSWPGNVRELSNLVERLAILHPSGEIGIDELPAKYREARAAAPAPDEREPADADLPGISLKLHLREIEKNLIEQALDEADGVVAHAARLLKMRRTTLVEKLAKYGLSD